MRERASELPQKGADSGLRKGLQRPEHDYRDMAFPSLTVVLG
jgi:hypothetical protein